MEDGVAVVQRNSWSQKFNAVLNSPYEEDYPCVADHRSIAKFDRDPSNTAYWKVLGFMKASLKEHMGLNQVPQGISSLLEILF